MHQSGHTWPYAVAAIIVLALQAGWQPEEIRNLAATLLVLITLLIAAHRSG
jgi:hypothetical protein